MILILAAVLNSGNIKNEEIANLYLWIFQNKTINSGSWFILSEEIKAPMAACHVQ